MPQAPLHQLVRTARFTGVCYLALAISGACGFLLIRGQLFVADDADQTLAHVVGNAWRARIGVALELTIALSQTLAAFGFYRLFRSVDAVVSGTLAACGLVNAVVILCSAACLATSLDVAFETGIQMGGATAGTVQLLYVLSGHLWGVGCLFFGLWLLPMGWLVRRSGFMPSMLGLVLVVGGCGYVLSAFVVYLSPGLEAAADLLALPATVGEFWMIGYLLSKGVSSKATRLLPEP